MQRGELEAGVAAPGVHAGAPVLRADGNRQGVAFLAVFLDGLEHRPVAFERPVEQGPGDILQDLLVHAIPVVKPGHLRHPRRAGVVDRARPERAADLAAVVHGVGQHERVRRAEELLRVLPQLRQPRPDQVPQRTEVRQAIRAERRPVDHLDVDVEVVVVAPGRQLVLLHPRALKSGRQAFRRGQPGLLVHPVVVGVLQVLVGQFQAGNVLPVLLPPPVGPPREPVDGDGGRAAAGLFPGVRSESRADHQQPRTPPLPGQSQRIVLGKVLAEAAALGIAPSLGRRAADGQERLADVVPGRHHPNLRFSENLGVPLDPSRFVAHALANGDRRGLAARVLQRDLEDGVFQAQRGPDRREPVLERELDPAPADLLRPLGLVRLFCGTANSSRMPFRRRPPGDAAPP